MGAILLKAGLEIHAAPVQAVCVPGPGGYRNTTEVGSHGVVSYIANW